MSGRLPPRCSRCFQTRTKRLGVQTPKSPSGSENDMKKLCKKKRKANAKAAAGSAAVESTADASQTQGAARPESQQQPGRRCRSES